MLKLFDVTTTSKGKFIRRYLKMTNVEMCTVLSEGLFLVSHDKFQQIVRKGDGKEKLIFFVENRQLKVYSTVDIWNTIYIISELLSKIIVA